MAKNPGIRQGDIFWLNDCPPLAGHVAKRRPVIVISPPGELEAPALVLVVATSSSALANEADRIALPNRQEEPQTKTGLPRACWAVPRWYLLVGHERLTERIGFLRGSLLTRLLTAVDRRMKSDGVK